MWPPPYLSALKRFDDEALKGSCRKNSPLCFLRASLLRRFSSAFALELHQGISPELVGHTLPDAVAFDDIARLNLVRQDHDITPHGAARLLHLGHRPSSILLARPEREPRSIRAVKELTACDPRRDLDLLPSPWTPNRRHAHSFPRVKISPKGARFSPGQTPPRHRRR